METTPIQVPAPMEIGDVNSHLVHGEQPTLIDAGPADGAAFEAIRTGIEDAGLAVEDIEQVLLTHPHSDHFGNAARIREISGADVMARPAAASIVQDFPAHKDRQMAFFIPYLEHNGVPSGRAREVLDRNLPNQYDTALPVDRVVEDGDTVTVGPDTELTVHAMQSHARGSAAFIEADDGTAFTGDHVLPGITPNPMLMVPDDGEDRPPSSLTVYLETLRSFPDTVTTGYGGHGDRIEDVPRRIEEIVLHHQDRAGRVMDILGDDAMTPFEVMEGLFPGLEESQWFLGMSESIAHLRLLEDRGRLDRLVDEQVRYRER